MGVLWVNKISFISRFNAGGVFVSKTDFLVFCLVRLLGLVPILFIFRIFL